MEKSPKVLRKTNMPTNHFKNRRKKDVEERKRLYATRTAKRLLNEVFRKSLSASMLNDGECIVVPPAELKRQSLRKSSRLRGRKLDDSTDSNSNHAILKENCNISQACSSTVGALPISQKQPNTASRNLPINNASIGTAANAPANKKIYQSPPRLKKLLKKRCQQNQNELKGKKKFDIAMALYEPLLTTSTPIMETNTNWSFQESPMGLYEPVVSIQRNIKLNDASTLVEMKQEVMEDTDKKRKEKSGQNIPSSSSKPQSSGSVPPNHKKIQFAVKSNSSQICQSVWNDSDDQISDIVPDIPLISSVVKNWDLVQTPRPTGGTTATVNPKPATEAATTAASGTVKPVQSTPELINAGATRYAFLIPKVYDEETLDGISGHKKPVKTRKVASRKSASEKLWASLEGLPSTSHIANELQSIYPTTKDHAPDLVSLEPSVGKTPANRWGSFPTCPTPRAISIIELSDDDESIVELPATSSNCVIDIDLAEEQPSIVCLSDDDVVMVNDTRQSTFNKTGPPKKRKSRRKAKSKPPVGNSSLGTTQLESQAKKSKKEPPPGKKCVKKRTLELREESRTRDPALSWEDSRTRTRDPVWPRADSRTRSRDPAEPRADSRTRSRDPAEPRADSRTRSRDPAEPRADSRTRTRDPAAPRDDSSTKDPGGPSCAESSGRTCSRSRWDVPPAQSTVGSNVYVANPSGIVHQGLRPIIIDGSNVAFGHGNRKQFSTVGLQICIRYFKERGHKVVAFVPHFRVKANQSSNPALLRRLESDGDVILTPSRTIDGRTIASYDDRYIVQTAALKGGIIVTNDNYNDLLAENPGWAETIKYRCLAFNWVDDILIFPSDPLGRFGPDLGHFLRFPN